MEACEALADRTVMAFAPRQIEYHARDGRTRIWVGEHIYDGFWKLNMPIGLFGRYPNVYYLYVDSRGRIDSTHSIHGGVTVNQRYEGSLWIEGDPLNLMTRRRPPASLREQRGRLSEIVERFSGTPAD